MYALDANVFIQANNASYSFDICPAFWDWLDRAFADGRVLSVAAVLGEIQAGKDELASWVTARAQYFAADDDATTASLAHLSEWATGAGYLPVAVSEFLSGADYRLVAYAHAHDLTVVTYEVSRPESKKRIKIPDACAAMGVQCINPYAMLRAENVKFVLP
jgi:hypothetical protein